MTKYLLATVAALAVAAPAQATTNFFTNWDSTTFSNPANYVILPSYEGWTAVSGDGIEVQFNSVAGTPYSGNNLVELDSNNNSAMQRTIDAGKYMLTYFYSPRPDHTPAASNGIDVLVNGATVQSVSGIVSSNTNWVQHTVYFTLASTGTLGFAATGASNSFGGYLEDIRLTAVPEPAAWAMMLMGFGFAGAALRRRRQPVRVSFA